MLVLEEHIWVVVVGFIIAFILSFGIGANDVANSFGTSVGSKVLTLRQACTLATIFELLGAVLLGSHVSTTIRSGITDITPLQNQTKGVDLLLYGQISSLFGSCLWLLVATFFRIPVSGTHSIVGSTMGFALVLFGVSGIKWLGLIKIVASWFISPVLSGLISVILFLLLRKFVLTKDEPLEPALRTLPLIYGVAVIVNSISILLQAPPMLRFNLIPVWGKFLVSCSLGVIVALLVKFIVIPKMRHKILKQLQCPNKAQVPADQQVVSIWQKLMRKIGIKKKKKQEDVIEPDKKHQSSLMELQVEPQLANSPEEVEVHYTTLQTAIPIFKTSDAEHTTNDNNEQPPLVELYIPVIKDRPAEAKVFSFVQILTAVLGSFAHGGNDVR
ncbi:hypothetical protein Ciccas_007124 [Cichlidogyrus casuarinus]|uniref:Phosphate transporter n=1 Tax=Cichlidogyrus casuarinus TaxID=1844966 RepID=A0ABD2Q3S5_9PLAT